MELERKFFRNFFEKKIKKVAFGKVVYYSTKKESFFRFVSKFVSFLQKLTFRKVVNYKTEKQVLRDFFNDFL